MKKLLSLIALAAFPALLGTGCVSTSEYDRAVKHLETEQDAKTALSAENARLEAQNQKLARERDSYKKSLEEIKSMPTVEVDTESLLTKIQKLWDKDAGNNSDWEVLHRGGAVGVRIDDKGVLFRTGSWELTEKTKGTLAKLATLLKERMDATSMVRVDGHTDSDPVKRLKAEGIQDNVHLSIMRAQAVRNYLVSQGIAADRIFVAGFGEFWPIAANADTLGKQRNRRVEVYMGSADGLSIGQPAPSGEKVSKEPAKPAKTTVEKTKK